MASSTKNLVTGLFALMTICGIIINGAFGKPPARINGGEIAYPGAFSFVVSIAYPSSTLHSCGGAVISPRHILTAAHCISKQTPNTRVIRGGMHDLNDKNAIVRNIKGFVIHPNYQPWIKDVQNIENDIGIVVLDRDLDFKSGVLGKIDLPIAQPDIGKFYHVAGWGRLSAETSVSSIMRFAPGIILLNDVECRKKYGDDFAPTKLCGYKEDATICPGDSGSPLVSGGRIVGIASMGNCSPGSPHGYVNVYHYINWIRSVIAQTS